MRAINSTCFFQSADAIEEVLDYYSIAFQQKITEQLCRYS